MLRKDSKVQAFSQLFKDKEKQNIYVNILST